MERLRYSLYHIYSWTRIEITLPEKEDRAKVVEKPSFAGEINISLLFRVSVSHGGKPWWCLAVDGLQQNLDVEYEGHDRYNPKRKTQMETQVDGPPRRGVDYGSIVHNSLSILVSSQ